MRRLPKYAGGSDSDKPTAHGQGGSGSAGDTLPTYALTVNAFQGGSADAALIMLDVEVWRPRISADLGSWGAAGTHTFRVKSGLRLPQTLAILPVEAIPRMTAA